MNRSVSNYITDILIGLWLTGIIPMILCVILIGGLGAILG